MSDIVPVENLMNKIIYLREQKVMLDSDLADLYGVETRVLNQSVSRNIERFPDDFVFELTRDEIMNISQFVISSQIKHSKRVRAFTEQGIAMLSSVLRSERAIKVNIAIMRAFVKLRELLLTNKELNQKLMEIENKYDKQFRIVFEVLQQIMEKPEKPPKEIGFK
ncbi:MAG: ORF6N domain-containing protein [Candidatus Cloacimonadales bacterium]|nr:ORF6N domain-containing protein [Candidatus Cloacimonadales bacterium]